MTNFSSSALCGCFEKNINSINLEKSQILSKIRQSLEKLMEKQIELKDDISESIISGQDIPKDISIKE